MPTAPGSTPEPHDPVTTGPDMGTLGLGKDSSSRTTPPSDPPAPDSGGVEAEIWGPRAFTPFRLTGEDPREGGAREWVSRALVTAYFLAHDNEPAPMTEICEWTEALTPLGVLDAVLTAVHVGLP